MERETATITLGGRQFTVTALSIKDSRLWRDDFNARLGPMLAQLGALPDRKFDSVSDLMTLVPLLEKVLLGGIDQLIELLFAFSPALAESREWIEVNATDKEALAAFQEVMTLADPFGVVGMFGGKNGRATTPTSGNSAAPSGASGQRKSKSGSARAN